MSIENKVVIIDTNLENLIIQTNQLKLEGFQTDVHLVNESTRDSEVLDFVRKSDASIVFLAANYFGNDGSGIRDLKAIKSYKPTLPVVIYSGRPPIDRDFEREAKELGADYLQKPIFIDEVVRVIVSKVKPYTVLLIEDEPEISDDILAYFIGKGIRTKHAKTTSEGLNLVSEGGVHLVFTDLNQNPTGVAVYNKAVSRGLASYIITGGADRPDLLQEAQAAAGDRLLIRPIALSALLEKVQLHRTGYNLQS